jgi:hypothetical protein
MVSTSRSVLGTGRIGKDGFVLWQGTPEKVRLAPSLMRDFRKASGKEDMIGSNWSFPSER